MPSTRVLWFALSRVSMLVSPLYGRLCYFFFSSRRRHTICLSDWSSDVCSSDLTSLQQWAAELLYANIWPKIDCATCQAGPVNNRWRQLEVARQRPKLHEWRGYCGWDRSEERRVGKECRCRWAW